MQSFQKPKNKKERFVKNRMKAMREQGYKTFLKWLFKTMTLRSRQKC